jgi:hypothetical protein
MANLSALLYETCENIQEALPSPLDPGRALWIAGCIAGAPPDVPVSQAEWNAICGKLFGCGAAEWPVDEAALTNYLNQVAPAPTCLDAATAMGLVYCSTYGTSGPDPAANGLCYVLLHAPWYALSLLQKPLCPDAAALMPPVPSCLDPATAEVIDYCRASAAAGAPGPDGAKNGLCWLAQASGQLAQYLETPPCPSAYVEPSAEPAAVAPPGAEALTFTMPPGLGPETVPAIPGLPAEVLTEPVEPAPAPAAPDRQRKMMIGIGVGVGVIALGGLAWYMMRKRRAA